MREKHLTPYSTRKTKSIAYSIHGLFRNQAIARPNALAAIYDDKCFSYEELDVRSDTLAWRLIKMGVQPQQPVAICVERSFDMIVGLLGILKAGAAYVPLDSGRKFPKERLQYIVNDCDLSVLVTQRRLQAQLSVVGLDTICVDDEYCFRSAPREVASVRVEGTHLAYILYTTGTTGQPKGVLVEHHSVVNAIENGIERYGLTAADRTLAYSSICFDSAISKIFCILSVGGAIIIPREKEMCDFECILRLIARHKVTCLGLSPTLVSLLNKRVESIPRVRVISCGGEELTWAHMDNLVATKHVINAYGPTETTVCATAYHITPADVRGKGQIPIGRPLRGYHVYILNPDYSQVQHNEPGEIFISGTGVARGYVNDATLTAKHFVPCPYEPGERMFRTGDIGRQRPDGNIEFLGRSDQIVKVRGYRVSLGEIEAALLQHPDVWQVGVRYIRKQLVAFLSPITCAKMDSGKFKAYLEKKLPSYMIPGMFQFLSELPLTPNGKVDRNALHVRKHELDLQEDDDAALLSEAEQLVRSIWLDALKTQNIGADDDFIEMGGHSILALDIASRLSREAMVTISMQDVLELSTVRRLAQRLEARLLARNSSMGIRKMGPESGVL